MAFAPVQRKGKGTSGTSIAIGAGDGWATPTAGNLLVVTANSDALVTITDIGTAWTAGPSVIDGNGAYFWYKTSQGTETTITCTPSVSDTICITACEYSGVAASPFDTSNSSTIAGTSGTTTTSTSVNTAADGDLIIAVALLHIGGAGSGTLTSPSWTNSFTNQLTATSGGSTSTDTTTFYAELIAGGPGSYSTSASWTGNAADRQQIIIAFKAAPTSGAVAGPYTAPAPGRLSPTGLWTPFPYTSASGPQTYTQNLAGTVSPAGALAKQDQKPLAGTTTSSGALVKLPAKALAGTVTSAGALAKLALKAAAGTVTSSGSLARQCAKALAGTVGPAGALAKLVAKALAGTVTAGATLTTVKVLLRTFTGTVTSAGAVTRQAGKALAGVVSPAGALTKATARALSGAVTAGGALAKLARKALAGSTSSSGALTAQNVGATQNATSTPSTTATRTSTAAVTTATTSTPTVSDG